MAQNKTYSICPFQYERLLGTYTFTYEWAEEGWAGKIGKLGKGEEGIAHVTVTCVRL
jgi:hypothetical protein